MMRFLCINPFSGGTSEKLSNTNIAEILINNA